MRNKSSTTAKWEARGASALRRLLGYHRRSEEWRAAFDLRREFFRADTGYVTRVKQAAAGVAVAALGVAVGGMPRYPFDWMAVAGWALGIIGAVAAVRSLWAAWHVLDRFKEPDMLHHRVGEKLSALSVGGRPLPFHEVAPEHSSLPDLTLTLSDLAGEALERSPTFDDALMALPSLPFTQVGDRSGDFYLADQAMRQRQLDYLRYRIEEKKRTTNDAKFGLSFAFDVPIGPVELFGIGYYDALVTNEAFRSGIATRHINHGPKVEPIRLDRLDDHFPVEPDPDGDSPRLLPLTLAPTANHVGVTTLAITADGYPVLFLQGVHANIDAGSATLGGSGSVDIEDIRAADDPADLKAILRHAMARELQQETLLTLDGAQLAESAAAQEQRRRAYREATMVTGFFRWVNRCGKPEFVGLTALPDMRRQLLPNHLEVSPLDIDLPRVRQLSDLSHIADAIRAWAAGNPGRRRLGLSSAVCLTRASEIARGDPASPAFVQADRLLGRTVRDWRPTAR